jgi:hypothetical protein
VPKRATGSAPEAAALRAENERLRRELEDLRASTSFRVGHKLVRGANRLLPGRTVGEDALGGQADPEPAGEEETAGAGVEVNSADDLLVQAGDVPTEKLGDLLRMLRDELPAHASLVVGHDDPGELLTDVATRVLPPAHAKRVSRVFGPARHLRVLDVDGALQLVAGRPRTITPPSEQLQEPRQGLPEGPLFIGGTGRSGTWTLGHLFGAHPRWATIPTELRFHARPRGFGAVLGGRLSPEEFAEEFESRWYLPSGATGRPTGVQRLVGQPVLRWRLESFVREARHDVPTALGQLMLDVVGPWVSGQRALGWVETTPDNAEAAATLTTVFPEARVVHAIRDGRDVAASVATMPWGPDTIDEGLDWWAGRVRAAHEASRRAIPGRVHVTRLEELLYLDRDRVFADLVAFAGFEDDRAMRRYFDDRMDGSKGSLGRWRTQVADEEREKVDARYRDLIAELRESGVSCLPTDPDAVDELAGATA